MYNAFYGFRERPFQLTPNPRFLFLNPAHREALATLRYGLSSSLGITLLLGEAGTGKTTLLRAALDAESRPTYRCAVINNPTLTSADFFEVLADSFGLGPDASHKGRFLRAFEADVRERHTAGGQTALVIDEAHSLTHELFEEVRLLANIETPTAKLVNVILLGQPELAERLNHPSLRQFKQRVVLRCELKPLTLEWTGSYIASRVRAAGAVAGEVFTKEAVHAIYKASHGIPRVIGVICENVLLAGFAAQKKPIDRAIVGDVCRDLDLPLDTNFPHAVEEVPSGKPPAGQASGKAPAGQPQGKALASARNASANPPKPGEGGPALRSAEGRDAGAADAQEPAAPPVSRRRIFRIF